MPANKKQKAYAPPARAVPEVRKSAGTLYICATPIVNLEDTSSMLIRTLNEADIILAEDTRTVRKLLSRFAVSKPQSAITGYQDFSSEAKLEYVVGKINEGKNIALVSESGTPAIQDPGFRIIRRCVDEGIKISVIPGPNAALSALVLSGLSTDSFLFLGFLPRKAPKLKEKLQEVKYLPYTLIIYESPRRAVGLLEILLEQIGDRECSLARELTKIYEEVLRGMISEIIKILKERNNKGQALKGEITITVEGCGKEPVKEFSMEQIKREYKRLLLQNFSRKEALKILRSRFRIDRQLLYNCTLKA